MARKQNRQLIHSRKPRQSNPANEHPMSDTPRTDAIADGRQAWQGKREQDAIDLARGLEREATAWAKSANDADDRLKRALTAYGDLMGQILAMKERSDLYFNEAEAGSDEAEKHLRVFNVLKELERLGEAFRNR